jgi:hypothetical protein
MLRLILAWRAFWNLWTVYFFNFKFLGGRGKPRITETAGTESVDTGAHLYSVKKRLEKKETCPVQLGRTHVPHVVDWGKTRGPSSEWPSTNSLDHSSADFCQLEIYKVYEKKKYTQQQYVVYFRLRSCKLILLCCNISKYWRRCGSKYWSSYEMSLTLSRTPLCRVVWTSNLLVLRLQDLSLLPRRRCLRSSELLRTVCWTLFTDVSGQTLCSVLKGLGLDCWRWDRESVSRRR